VNISYVNDDKLVSVFSHLSDTFGIPASNNKVFTTVAAYTLLGPSFHTSTVVSLLNPSTLCFRASGDATMSHDGLNNLAWQVKELVKEVSVFFFPSKISGIGFFSFLFFFLVSPFFK
jgi:D-alanyl-D-alanine carboxypeptidase